jgi:hypothetical protein
MHDWHWPTARSAMVNGATQSTFQNETQMPMGLSIHYNGKFNPQASLPEMIEEIEEIAQVFNWKYSIFKRDFPKLSFPDEHDGEIYGISVSPAQCEPMWFTFLSNGRMSSPILLDVWGDATIPEEAEYLYQLFTKTQYAGKETHMLVVNLARYISNKYFSSFNMSDEGQYWESNDEKILEGIFERYNMLLDAFVSTIRNEPIREGESIKSYFERIVNELNRNFPRKT